MMGIVEVVAREMRRDFRIPRSLEHAGYGEVYRACSWVSWTNFCAPTVVRGHT
jgi:hypothetical protein